MADNQTPPNRGKDPKREPDDKFEWKKAARTMSFWMLIILIVIVVSTYLTPREREADVIDYSAFRELIKQELVDSAIITDREFVGKLKSPDAQGRMEFKTILGPITEEMINGWEEQGIKIEFKERATNWLAMILTSILPWIILIGLWVFFMRRMSGGANRGIFSFGKSKAKLIPENTHKVTFADVAGGEEAKEELQEIIQFLKDPKKFQRLGGRIPKGALLVGPPGTGKTLMARAVAGEAGVPFFSMSGADFVEMFVGVGASRVRDLFDQGKRNAPCIIFIDEIDAVGRQRGAGLGGGHDEREQTLNQLLVEMDGFEFNEGVILLAATNRPDVLDPALLRPGRFDRQIVVDRPDVRGREGILKVHTRNIPLGRDVNLKTLAKGTPGLAGADLANLVNEAALLAARRNANKVQMIDFENAKDKVMMGTERRSMLISDEEKKLTAYHESGHVLVAKLIPGSDPVHKVTIIPRGRALGVTHYLPIDEKHSWSKKYIEDKMVHLMGGRAAERLIFNDYTNGAAQDIKQATEIARRMVCDWGMSEKIGPLSLGAKGQEIFIGRDFGHQKDYSEATAIEIDREIKKLVMKAMNRAIDLLSNNMDKLHSLATALLDREILDGPEIDMVLEGKKLPKIKKHTAKPRRKKPTGRRPRRTTVVKTARDGVEKIDKKDNSERIKAVENALNLIEKDETPKERPRQGRPPQGRRPSTGSRGRKPSTPKPESKAPDSKPVDKKPEDKKSEE